MKYSILNAASVLLLVSPMAFGRHAEREFTRRVSYQGQIVESTLDAYFVTMPVIVDVTVQREFEPDHSGDEQGRILLTIGDQKFDVRSDSFVNLDDVTHWTDESEFAQNAPILSKISFGPDGFDIQGQLSENRGWRATGLFIDHLPNRAGDVTGNGVFDSSDLVFLFQHGRYHGHANWQEGDFNQDSIFDSSDLIHAFQFGEYEFRPPPHVVYIPEPAAGCFVFCLGLILMRIRRSQNIRQ